MNENPRSMVNRNFPMWPPPPAAAADDQIPFLIPGPPFFASDMGWIHRKGKKPANRWKNPAPVPPCPSATRRFTKRRFSRFAPFAPRNTTSFIIRAKKSGGIASQVSPYPVTPAILLTPQFSPSSEVLVDMAKEEWGVDGYGSMKGLIRLRSPVEDQDQDEVSSEGSDVEEHVEVERRLDQDLSRFEMVYDLGGNGLQEAAPFLVENWLSDQDSHMTELEEENLTLRERLFLMEREMEEMKSRLLLLEMRLGVNREDNTDAVEGVLDNDGDLCSEDH